MSRLKVAVTAVAMLGVLGFLAYGPVMALRYSDEIPSGRGAVRPDGAIDSNRLAPLYQGRLVSPRDIHRLQQKGRAQVGVVSVGLACQGVAPYFDDDREREEFTRANPAVTARPSPGCGDIERHPAFSASGDADR